MPISTFPDFNNVARVRFLVSPILGQEAERMRGRGNGQGINKASEVPGRAYHPGLSQRSAKQRDTLHCCPNGKSHTRSQKFGFWWCLFSRPSCQAVFAKVLVAARSLSHIQLFASPWTCSTPGFPVLHHLPELAYSWRFPGFVFVVSCLNMLQNFTELDKQLKRKQRVSESAL